METDLSRKFAVLFRDIPLKRLFANMNARAETLTFGGLEIPCTAVNRVTPNCYTASPHAAIVDYAKDELVKLPHGRRAAAACLLFLLGGILRLCSIERMVTLNNYCLSTNSFSAAFQTASMTELTRAAVGKWPHHALSVRSLNERQHPGMAAALVQSGWQMVVSRQVYIMDDWQAVYAKTNTKRDSRLLNDGRYVFEPVGAQSPDTVFDEARHWYDRLYLHKYSRQNVHFTHEFLKEAVGRGILILFILRDAATGRSVGVSGIVADSDTATAPLVGYDDSIPQRDGLYRRCMAQAMRAARERGLSLNFSSGAPDFKKVRGARPAIEYMAVYTRHLSFRRRIVWTLLAVLGQRYYRKILIRYGL